MSDTQKQILEFVLQALAVGACGAIIYASLAVLLRKAFVGGQPAQPVEDPGYAEQVSALYIPGLGRKTDEDDGFVTLQFVNEAAAQDFMHNYFPTVDVTVMDEVDARLERERGQK